MLTRPRDLFYEVFVFGMYLKILEYVKVGLEMKTTLEKDLELLKTDLDWKVRMVIVYRVERKKIIRSQLRLIEKVLEDLETIVRYVGNKRSEVDPVEYQVIIMKKTKWEQEDMDNIQRSDACLEDKVK